MLPKCASNEVRTILAGADACRRTSSGPKVNVPRVAAILSKPLFESSVGVDVERMKNGDLERQMELVSPSSAVSPY
jgi:hypothetical protein